MKSRTWLTVTIIIILAIIAYFAYSYRNVLIPSGAESVINQLELQSTSDEVADIENDLDTTTLEGLDSELESIEKELGGASI